MPAHDDRAAHQVGDRHRAGRLAQPQQHELAPGPQAADRPVPRGLDADGVDGDVRRPRLDRSDGLEHDIRSQRARRRAPLRNRLDGHHRGALRERDVDRQEADRAAADHEQAAARPERVRTQRADADGERLDQGGVGVAEPLGHRQQRVARHRGALGEHAGAMHAEQLPALAQVLLAARAGGAGAADHEREHDVATGHPRDGADRLVTEHERRLPRPGMPAIGVQVRAADARHADIEHDLPGARHRIGQLLQRELRAAAPDERPHAMPASQR